MCMLTNLMLLDPNSNAMQQALRHAPSPPHEDVPTPFRLIMLMIKCTPRAPPRLTSLPLPPLPLLRRALALILTPPIIPPRHRNTGLHTRSTKTQTAIIARHSAMPRLNQTPTVLAAPRAMPAIRAPHSESMALERLSTRSLEQHTKVAEKMGVPRINVSLDETIRLLERKQIKHQFPQRRAVPNSLVQNPSIAGRQHAIRLVREIRNQIDDAVAQTLDAQAVRERVDVQEGVVRGFPILERGGDGAGVQPGDEEGEMVRAHIVECDGFRLAFDERAGERGAKVWRLRDEQRGMDAEGGEFGANEECCRRGEVLRVGAANVS